MNRTCALLAAVTLVACGKQGGVDTTPIQGTWQRDDEATMKSLMESQSKEFIDENLELYFRPTDAVLSFSGSQISVPAWGVTCNYEFDGEAVKVAGCPKEGNDGALTAGFDGYDFVDGKLLVKDMDDSVIAVYVKTDAPADAVAAERQVDAVAANVKEDGTGSDAWQSGWGQGVSEYFVRTADGSSINISCPDDSAAPVGISVTFVGNDVESPTLVVNGEEFQIDWVLSDCSACFDNYVGMWTKLRAAESVVVAAGGVTKQFPVGGLAGVLPEEPCAHAAQFAE